MKHCHEDHSVKYVGEVNGYCDCRLSQTHSFHNFTQLQLLYLQLALHRQHDGILQDHNQKLSNREKQLELVGHCFC